MHLGNTGGGILRISTRVASADGQRVPWVTLRTPQLVLEGAQSGGTIQFAVDGHALSRADVRHCSLILESNHRPEPRAVADSGTLFPPRLWDRWCRTEQTLPIDFALESPPELHLNTDELALDLWQREEDLQEHLRMTNRGGGVLQIALLSNEPDVLRFREAQFELSAGEWVGIPITLDLKHAPTDVEQTASILFIDRATGRTIKTAIVRYALRDRRELGVVFGVDFGSSTSKVATLMDGGDTRGPVRFGREHADE